MAFFILKDVPRLAPHMYMYMNVLLMPSNKLLEQGGYVKERLKSSLRKFYGGYKNLFKQYKVPLS